MSESEGAPREKPAGHTIPSPEVKENQTRTRRYLTAAYKLRILREADSCKNNSGEIGALLRREGLYSSHLKAWGKARDNGLLSVESEMKRGPRPKLSVIETENLMLKTELEKLRRQYDQAQKIIEAQKKIAEILGTTS